MDIVSDPVTAVHKAREKIRAFERKYAQTWEEFSKSVQEAANEDFERWDDYIEWKAQIKMAANLASKERCDSK
jgi:hypothetical protein